MIAYKSPCLSPQFDRKLKIMLKRRTRIPPRKLVRRQILHQNVYPLSPSQRQRAFLVNEVNQQSVIRGPSQEKVESPLPLIDVLPTQRIDEFPHASVENPDSPSIQTAEDVALPNQPYENSLSNLAEVAYHLIEEQRNADANLLLNFACQAEDLEIQPLLSDDDKLNIPEESNIQEIGEESNIKASACSYSNVSIVPINYDVGENVYIPHNIENQDYSHRPDNLEIGCIYVVGNAVNLEAGLELENNVDLEHTFNMEKTTISKSEPNFGEENLDDQTYEDYKRNMGISYYKHCGDGLYMPDYDNSDDADSEVSFYMQKNKHVGYLGRQVNDYAKPDDSDDTEYDENSQGSVFLQQALGLKQDSEIIYENSEFEDSQQVDSEMALPSDEANIEQSPSTSSVYTKL